MTQEDSPTAGDTRGFFGAVVGDGRSLVSLVGICLILSGGFALFQSATGHFLPQDSAYLQMSSEDLCKINECRIVHFMIHDRVSFGGALIGIGLMYLWMAEFPLRAKQAWAWWALLGSGVVGFGSFLTYLGYGYLDTWHGAATLALLPCFVAGLWRTRRGIKGSWKQVMTVGAILRDRSAAGIGRLCLLVAAGGLMGAGCTIQVVGMTSVFVPTDLVFLGVTPARLNQINPRLMPLIAHDRAGFGGAAACMGLLLLTSVWMGMPSRSLWQVLMLAGVVGWGTAIGVHPLIGYLSVSHLTPAVLGAGLYFAGLGLMAGKALGRGHAGLEIPA